MGYTVGYTEVTYEAVYVDGTTEEFEIGVVAGASGLNAGFESAFFKARDTGKQIASLSVKQVTLVMS